jgi:hypothetical protein
MIDKFRIDHIHITQFHKIGARNLNKIPIVLIFILFVIMLASSPMSVMNFYKIANAQNNSFNNSGQLIGVSSPPPCDPTKDPNCKVPPPLPPTGNKSSESKS